MVGYRNENSYGRIITVENAPVEYVHERGTTSITKRDVGVDTQVLVLGP